jgi:hypothetical protein
VILAANASPATREIVAAERVVGDGEDVEAKASVKVNQLAQRERAVAPGRMGVQLAEERLGLRPSRRAIGYAIQVAAP